MLALPYKEGVLPYKEGVMLCTRARAQLHAGAHHTRQLLVRTMVGALLELPSYVITAWISKWLRPAKMWAFYLAFGE